MLPKKPRVLLFIKVPPPVTGATLMNKRVHDSKLIQDRFRVRSICISYASSVADLGNFKIQKLLLIARYYFELLYELTFHRPKIVYFQISPLGGAFFRDVFYVLAIKFFWVRIVFHLRGKGIKKEIKGRFKKILYRFVFKGESVICLSELLYFDVEDIYKGKPYFVNNGYPYIDFTNIEQNQKKLNNTPKILFLSNLIISKGLFDYLDALILLANKNIPFEAFIVGSEADLNKQQIIQEIEIRKIKSKVSYLGAQYNAEKANILNISDIFVFPTKNDCFPGVVLDAMQAKLPIITTREGAIPDIIDDGINGFLVDYSSPNQISEKIEYLINNPTFAKEMGLAGRKKYEEKYTLQHFEQNLCNVFDDILKRI